MEKFKKDDSWEIVDIHRKDAFFTIKHHFVGRKVRLLTYVKKTNRGFFMQCTVAFLNRFAYGYPRMVEVPKNEKYHFHGIKLKKVK